MINMKDYLNFIDISVWQRGLDLSAVFEKNPLDGVIVKATGGTSYVNPTCDPWVQWLINNNKPWGFYHFLNDDGRKATGEQEANFFVEHCANYFGDGVPIADFEGTAVSLGTTYLMDFLDTVTDMTGIQPLVYCNLATIQENKEGFKPIANKGYKLWLAQYANNRPSSFSVTPWQNGSYAPFDKITMHQYSANGFLTGYAGAVDLDRFYGNSADWDSIVSGLQKPVYDADFLIAQGVIKTPNYIENALRQLPRDLLNQIYTAIRNIIGE